MTGSTIRPSRNLKILLGGLLLLAAGTSLPSHAAADARVSAESTADQAMDRRLDQLFGHHQDYRSFFEHFRQAVRDGEQTLVALLLHYLTQEHPEGQRWNLFTVMDTSDLYCLFL